AAAARAAGLALAPRGGGMSYTAGFQPGAAEGRPVVLVDLCDLDAVQIDPEARVARVGAGATWAALHEAAAAHGLRAPFFGPLSGLVAKVGGALSQNGAFFGSAAHGYAAQSVVGLQIADGTGRLIRLGAEAAGAAAALPWLGPGLLQAFLGDNGAFGVKTEALIRLLPAPPAPRFASYAFDDGASLARAQAALIDIPHLAEVWAFDREAHDGLARTGFSVLETAAMAGEVAGQAGGLFSAARRLAEAAMIRRAVLTELAWSLHLVIEPPVASLAEPIAEAAEAAILAAGGRAIPDAVPRATRARPFRPLKALIGPDGERWLPCHGVFPAAQAADAVARVEAWKAERAEAMAGQGIRVSLLLATVGAEIIVEPQLHWPDALSAHQRAFGTPRQAEAHANKPARPDARALAAELRGELIALFRGLGAGRLQIGRRYAYAEDLAPETLSLARALKRAVDPDGILNPGVLGL
ncbi:MAG: FAD-binding oxidoreductase, partial [Pseudomonadota bacterium]